MRDVNLETMREMERTARDIAATIGSVVRKERGHGFALFIFSFAGPEMTYISNANREDMVRCLQEFIARNVPAKPYDEQDAPFK